MNAGKRNQRIQIQRRTTARDGLGQNHGWEDAFKLWVNDNAKTGKKHFAADQVHSSTYAAFTANYRADIDPATMRVVYRGTTYDLESILPDQTKNEIVLLCRSGVRDAVA